MTRYAVGFGKPPKSTRFKKGQSGNPNGRPKGTRNLRNDLEDELAERIPVRESGTERRLSKQRALLKSLIARAIGGDARAVGLALGLMSRILEQEEPAPSDLPLNDDDEAVLNAFTNKILSEQKSTTGRHRRAVTVSNDTDPSMAPTNKRGQK